MKYKLLYCISTFPRPQLLPTCSLSRQWIYRMSKKDCTFFTKKNNYFVPWWEIIIILGSSPPPLPWWEIIILWKKVKSFFRHPVYNSWQFSLSMNRLFISLDADSSFHDADHIFCHSYFLFDFFHISANNTYHMSNIDNLLLIYIYTLPNIVTKRL